MAKSESLITVQAINRGEIEFFIVGESPLILNSMSAKAMRELLFPKKKTKADREQNLKHNPLMEFRTSVYRASDKRCPTELVFPSTGIKSAIATAALETPGAVKSQIGRLTYVKGEYVELYGIPQLFMAVVRSADMNRTPDVRTRAILAEWAMRFTVSFIKPTLNEQIVATLLANAGEVIGEGDFRQEKGKGNYGRFRIASAKDATLLRLMKTSGRQAQQAALDDPEPYDVQTSELLSWFNQELKARGRSQEVRA